MMRLFGRLGVPDPRFVIEDFEPVYLRTWRNGQLDTKVAVDSEDTKSDDVFISDGEGYATGVATMCIGMGQGVATVFEQV